MSILAANKVYTLQILMITCFFGESLKLESVWDHDTVNMKFNVFYSTFTNVFILVTF